MGPKDAFVQPISQVCRTRLVESDEQLVFAFVIRYYEMSSLSEGRIARLIRDPETLPRLRTHNQSQLTRIYPAGTRVMSNNMEGEDVAAAWGAGCHMIALNFQVG